MFYADFVLSKKGPLARIWLAAHWDKKLTKAQIFETNIESSIERILRPKVKLALRTSGHLMLGVVRIYSRKTKYLLADCNEAFVKIKMAFRPGMVDLPEDHREAAVNAVTLPEVFHDFDSAMPDLNDVDIEAQFTLNQSRADEITMREDYGNVPALHAEDGFDLGFDTSSADILRHSVGFDQSLQQANLLFGEGIDAVDKNRDRPSTSDVSAALGHISMDVDMPKDDDFGHGGGGLFEGGLFEDTHMPEVPVVDNSLQLHDPMQPDGAVPSTSKRMSPDARSDGFAAPLLNDDDDFDDDHFIPPSPGGGSSDGSRPVSPIPSAVAAEVAAAVPSVAGAIDQFLASTDLADQPAAQADLSAVAGPDVNQHVEGADNHENQNAEQTTLLQNEEESFALAPVDASALRGLPKTKRKRKLIVDEVKNISGEEMKAQLSDTSDIVITLDLAPPTKRLMHWKETGGVEKLFALPGKSIPSTSLFKNYQRHLTSKAAPNEEGIDDRDNIDAVRDVNQDGLDLNPPQVAPVSTRRGRKRKQAALDEEPEMLAAIEEEPPEKLAIVEEVPEQPAAIDVEPEKLLPVDSVEPEQPAVVDEQPAQPAEPEKLAVVEEVPEPVPTVPVTEDTNTGLFNFNVDNEHNPVTPGMNVGGGVTPWHDADYDNPVSVGPIDPNAGLFNFNDDNEHNNPVTPGMNAGGGVTPWHDADYDNPPSVGPMEERGVDETVEQFEERLLNKRAGHLYSSIRMRIATEAGTVFSDLIIGNGKKQVAQKFYSLLVLKKHKVLELTQELAYSPIYLTKGPDFDDPKL